MSYLTLMALEQSSKDWSKDMSIIFYRELLSIVRKLTLISR